MKKLKTRNILKKFQSITIYRWPERLLSIVHMALLVISIFVITMKKWLQLLLHQVSCRSGGLKIKSTITSMEYYRLQAKIILLRQIQIPYMLRLTSWSANLLARELMYQQNESSTSWTRSLRRKWNRILISVMKNWPSM